MESSRIDPQAPLDSPITGHVAITTLERLGLRECVLSLKLSLLTGLPACCFGLRACVCVGKKEVCSVG